MTRREVLVRSVLVSLVSLPLLLACPSESKLAPLAPEATAPVVHIGAEPVDAGDAGSASDAASDTGRVVNYLGRFAMDDAGAARFSWSGSALEVRFRGRDLLATFEDPGWTSMDVRIDGKPAARVTLQKGMHKVQVASNLSEGIHVPRLARRIEGHGGVTTFYGFEADEILPAPELPTLRLEFVGDSISCGFGVDGVSPCSFEYATENHENAFPGIVGRLLGAEVRTLAWSGFGMLRGADGTPSTNMPAYSSRTLATQKDPQWDFSTWQPHAVVINLSTNDFAKGDPGLPFQNATLTFLRTLRTRYPKATVLVTTSPLMHGARLARSKEYFVAAIAARNAEGDTNVALLEVPEQTEHEPFGCGRHPSKGVHQKVAEVIAAALRARLHVP
jgi:hypothetical protein